MRAIAIDDEPRALETIRRYAEKTPFLQLEQTFRDPLTAIAWWQEQQVELVFVDINMPNLSGLKIREFMPQAHLIFTTAYSEFAVESYELNAIDYLVKPIPFDRFLKACLKAKSRQELLTATPVQQPTSTQQQASLFIKSGSKHYQLPVDRILFIEKDGNYVTFHTSDSKVLSRLTMPQVLELLPSGFLQVHKSYIVALQQIEVLEPHQVTIAGRRVPVSKTYRSAVLEALAG
ncbi:MAG: response regulator transcription factor [Phaeodactylibacter sp.]|nr:response regulator transcription factor [Phaeodactylibacter sp.]